MKPVFLQMAARNVRRHLRRSALAAGAMAFGAAALVVLGSLKTGVHNAMVRSAVRANAADIVISPADGSPPFSAERTEAVMRLARSMTEIQAVAPRLRLQGIATGPRGSRPVALVGVDPAAEHEASVYDRRLASGRFIRQGEAAAVALGQGLADDLGASAGDRIRLVPATGTDGRSLEAEVVGVVRIGGEVGRAAAFVERQWLARQTGGGAANAVAVILRGDASLDEAAARLRRGLASAGLATARVRTWKEILPTTVDIIRLDDVAMGLFMAVVFVTVALGTLSTMLMSVYERFHELGVLRAVGTGPLQCVRLVLWEALVVAAVGLAVGLGAGLAVSGYFAVHGLDLSAYLTHNEHFALDRVIYAELGWWQFVWAALVVGATAIVGAVGPAIRAARLEVTEALRFT